MPTLKEIAQAAVEHNEQNKVDVLLANYYAPDAVSVEASESPEINMSREARGLDAIRAKHDWWNGSMEMLEGTIEGPFYHGTDRFALVFKSKVKEKATGDVSDMEEVAIYHVRDGKIVREEFYYEV